MKILICGSRDATQHMIEYTEHLTWKIVQRGDTIIAGDAIGVDQAVASASAQCRIDLDGMPKLVLRIYGIQPEPRHGVYADTIDYVYLTQHTTQQIVYGKRSVWVYNQRHQITTYRDRDRYMVDQADHVVCIWNGTSRGTLAVYDYAKSRGVPTTAYNFARKQSK